MTKNAKKYLKLYHEKSQECLEKYGYNYPPLSFEAFEAWNDNTFNKHLQDFESETKKVKLYLSLLGVDIKYFGYFIAFSEENHQKLNDVLWQHGRTELLNDGITGSGTLYTGSMLGSIFLCFANNDFEPLEAFFSPDLPLLKGKYYTENIANLLKSFHYKQENELNEAKNRANKFLQKAITAYERYFVEFFIGLVEKNAEKLSSSLQELCSAYQKQGYPLEKIDKCFAGELHGLYRLIYFYDKILFNEVKMPSHDCFFTDFERWQKENNYPKGKQFYKYPPKMDYMNQLLHKKIPTLHYIKNDNDFYTDTDKFANDLI